LFPVVNFLKCVVTEVVLFSIVAFKTATHMQLFAQIYTKLFKFRLFLISNIDFNNSHVTPKK